MLRTVLLSSCSHFGCTGFLYLTENPICAVQNNSHIFFMFHWDTLQHAMYSQWCCRNLGGGETCNLFTQTSSCSRRNGDKSEAQKPSLTDTSTINFSLYHHNCQCNAFKFPQEISTTPFAQYDISMPENPCN